MAKWVLLKEALMYPEKYGDISSRQISYMPDKRVVTLGEWQTGVKIFWKYATEMEITEEEDSEVEDYEVEGPQTFETETDHTWYGTLYEGKVYLVTGEATRQELNLEGEIGYEDGEKAQREISKLYENEELGTKGEIWSEDTINMVTKTLQLRLIRTPYWTAIKYIFEPSENDCFFGLYLVTYDTLYHSKYRDHNHLYNSNGNGYTTAASVRPLVYAPDDILVDIEGLEGDTPLKIKRSDSQEEEKAKGDPSKEEEKPMDIEGLEGDTPLKIKHSDSQEEEKPKGDPSKEEEKPMDIEGLEGDTPLKIKRSDSQKEEAEPSASEYGITREALHKLKDMARFYQDKFNRLNDLIRTIENGDNKP